MLASAALDYFIARDGRTRSGRRFPGQWVNRRGPTRHAAALLREDARQLFFEPDRLEDRTLCFQMAGWAEPPGATAMMEWLYGLIDLRGPRAPFCLDVPDV